jgi:hypothetical protein
MPSEDRTTRVLDALSAPRQAFRAALVSAIDELNGVIAEQRAPVAARAGQEAVRLGAFAAGHIDADRFSSIVAAADLLEPAQLDQLAHALRILRSFAAQGDELFHMRVMRNADLRDAVRDALAARGRAFNTAHQVEILRAGRGVEVELEYGTLDFRHWTRRERLIAPPLVVEINAADVQPAGLAEYLDGNVKVVLVIDGRPAPAPLARLIAPNTFVAQTPRIEDVARLAAYDGPGIVALVDEDADVAHFIHDPARGSRLDERLEVQRLPTRPRGRVAGISVYRQAEELRWLEELKRCAELEAANRSERDEAQQVQVTPADQLAAWLLRQGEAAGGGQ